MSMSGQSSRKDDLRAALAACRAALLGVAAMSGVVNILYLSGAFFMLEIYDRVLPSRSVPTLVGLAALIAILYAVQGILDLVRSRILVRIGASLDETLNERVYSAVLDLPLSSAHAGTGTQPLHDLDQVRSFLSSPGPIALFDLPWMPIYLGICFLLHSWIGITASVGAAGLIALTLLTEALTRRHARLAAELGSARQSLAEASRRNAEVLRAMGFGPNLARMWGQLHGRYLTSQSKASDIGGGFGSVSKILRLALQSAVLGVGAYLVIAGQATAGVIIAGAILTSRALAPVEVAIAHWKGFVSTRQSWRRLGKVLASLPTTETPLALPPPSRSLKVENVSAAPPRVQRLVLQDVGFQLAKGDGLGIIGQSGSGKSSLARLLVGVWRPLRGKVRLDGAALEQWRPEALGRHIGYLPQDVELFSGTVAQNIARFDPDARAEAIIAAARAAGVHDMILGLPQGYETEIGESGAVLSAGQRQRVALARALYGDPFLVVLDEPNSNLDSDGEEALTRALRGVRQRNGIVVVVAHRPSALAALDTLLMLSGGRVAAIGPKEEVLAKVLRRPPPAAAPLKVVADAAAGAP